MNFTLEMAFNVVMGLAAFLGAGFAKHLQSEIKELHITIEKIKQDYQRRDDAIASQKHVIELLNRVERTVERIDAKLDRKADK